MFVCKTETLKYRSKERTVKELSCCRRPVMILTCRWWSTEWDGPLFLWLLSPPRPPPPSSPYWQLAAGTISSNLSLAPWWHHGHNAYRPQVGVIDEELHLFVFCVCVLVSYVYLNTSDCTFSAGMKLKYCGILCVQNTFHTQRVFFFPLLFLVLCAPLEMSPCSLQFHMQHLAPQSDGYTKVSTRISCMPSAIYMFYPLFFPSFTSFPHFYFRQSSCMFYHPKYVTSLSDK